MPNTDKTQEVRIHTQLCGPFTTTYTLPNMVLALTAVQANDM
jgi:hypothetical protein